MAPAHSSGWQQVAGDELSAHLNVTTSDCTLLLIESKSRLQHVKLTMQDIVSSFGQLLSTAAKQEASLHFLPEQAASALTTPCSFRSSSTQTHPIVTSSAVVAGDLPRSR